MVLMLQIAAKAEIESLAAAVVEQIAKSDFLRSAFRENAYRHPRTADARLRRWMIGIMTFIPRFPSQIISRLRADFFQGGDNA